MSFLMIHFGDEKLLQGIGQLAIARGKASASQMVFYIVYDTHSVSFDQIVCLS